MLKLDLERYRAQTGNNKPNVMPPYSGEPGEEFSRPALYEFDGHLYDANGYQTGAGFPAETPATAAVRKATAEAAQPAQEAEKTPGMSPAELLRRVDELPWPTFKKHAKAILGNTCPAGKDAILAALQSAIEAYTARLAKRNGQHPFGGVSWDGVTGAGPDTAQTAAPTETQTPTPAQPSAGKGGVDLAAWGRGQQEYLFGEVQKALRTQHHIQFMERRDALNFLIDQGVVQASQARRDIS